jgi:hypothetical protein
MRQDSYIPGLRDVLLRDTGVLFAKQPLAHDSRHGAQTRASEDPRRSTRTATLSQFRDSLRKMLVLTRL